MSLPCHIQPVGRSTRASGTDAGSSVALPDQWEKSLPHRQAWSESVSCLIWTQLKDIKTNRSADKQRANFTIIFKRCNQGKIRRKPLFCWRIYRLFHCISDSLHFVHRTSDPVSSKPTLLLKNNHQIQEWQYMCFQNRLRVTKCLQRVLYLRNIIVLCK